jgi:hypothetical protein
LGAVCVCVWLWLWVGVWVQRLDVGGKSAMKGGSRPAGAAAPAAAAAGCPALVVAAAAPADAAPESAQPVRPQTGAALGVERLLWARKQAVRVRVSCGSGCSVVRCGGAVPFAVAVRTVYVLWCAPCAALHCAAVWCVINALSSAALRCGPAAPTRVWIVRYMWKQNDTVAVACDCAVCCLAWPAPALPVRFFALLAHISQSLQVVDAAASTSL